MSRYEVFGERGRRFPSRVDPGEGVVRPGDRPQLEARDALEPPKVAAMVQFQEIVARVALAEEEEDVGPARGHSLQVARRIFQSMATGDTPRHRRRLRAHDLLRSGKTEPRRVDEVNLSLKQAHPR